MNDNLRLGLSLLGLIFCSAWIFEKAKGSEDGAEIAKPKLNISENFIDVMLNSTLYIQCTGQLPLSWGFKDPKNRNKKYQDVKTVLDSSQSDEGFQSIIQLDFTSFLQTGEYACYHNNSSTSLYIFVNDESHLLLPLHYFPFLTLHEGTRSVIPCLPTISQANVTLWKVKKPNAEKIALDYGIKYDPTQGFLLRYPTTSFKGSFICLVEFQNLSENLTLNIDILPQTQSIPEVSIDDKNAQYVLLHSNFTLRCNIKVRLGTISYPPKWSHPVKDENRIITGALKIKKNNFHKMISDPLTIINAQKSDEGIYQCNVSDHSNRENYSQVQIKVYENPLEPAVNFTTGLYNIVKSRGDNINLITGYTVFPYTSDIRSLWTKDNDQLPLTSSKYTIKQSNSEFILEILNLTSLDAGLYTVTAYTSGGTFNKTIHLRVKDTPIIKVESAASCCFVPGQTYQLQCHSAGFPTPNLSWSWIAFEDCVNASCSDSNRWRNVDEVKDVNNNTQWVMILSEEKVWALLNVTAQNSGYYKCVSQNEMGITEQKVQFIVTDAKNGFEIEVEDILPLEMDPFSLTCKVSSDLYKDVYWRWSSYYQNESGLSISNELLNKSSTDYSITSKMELESIFHNHTGNYSCFAISRNREKPEVKSVFIRVREIQEPIFLNSNWDSEVIAAPNSVLELNCSVDGTPSPKITWYRNGVLLTSNLTGGRFEDDFQKLVITRLVDHDSGVYACVAENVAGTVMRNMSLSVASSGVPVTMTQNTPESMQVWILVAVGIGATSMLILLLILGKWFYKRKYTRMKLQGFTHQLFEEGHFGVFDPNMPLDEQADLLPYDNRWEFPKENLKFGRTLGQGAFGRVVKAEAFGLNDYEKSTTVAVKMLKERADVNQQKALTAELKILIHLGHHVNIVNLMGAVTKNIPKGELLVMVEYCQYGNLRNYLLRYRDKFVEDTDLYNRSTVVLSESPPLDSNATCLTDVRFDSFMSTSGSGSTVLAVDNPNYRQRVQSIVCSDPKGSASSHIAGRSMSCSSGSESRYYCRVDSEEHVITTTDLLCFSFQCACGMDYLSSRKLIHRDLAARNVLLADDKVVKICDFGLAKDCYKYENYVKKGDGPLPIKWMAIESIRDHVFTTKSDVWSFGILMWEFFTLGRNPYPGIEIDEEFYKRLNAGYRMEKPDHCPQDIYHIMQDCWLANPDDRPGFSEISDTLGGLMETGVKQHYIDLNAPYLEMNSKMQNHNYLNLPENEYQSNPTRLYMNSDTNNSWMYDNVPTVHRSIFDTPAPKETSEVVPMVQLATFKENDKINTTCQEDCPPHYLQMGESY